MVGPLRSLTASLMKRVIRRLLGPQRYTRLALLKARLKYLGRLTLLREPWLFVDRRSAPAVVRYGGWYLCPGLLSANSVVYSVGIGRDLSFDLALVEAIGARVIAFDPTPDAVAWLRTQRLPSGVSCRQVGLAGYDGRMVFHQNSEQGNPSYSSKVLGPGVAVECEVRKLATLMTEEGHHHLDLLKLDIEGAEYDVIDEIVNERIAVRQLLVEFHHRKLDRGRELTVRAVAKLKKAGFQLRHIAPGGQEYLFVHAGAAV